MSVSLSNNSHPEPGLGQNRPESSLSSDAGLGRQTGQGGTRRDETGDMVKAAAFAMQLAGARANAALDLGSDDSDVVVVATSPAPPLALMLAPVAEADPAKRSAETAALAQTLGAEVDAVDRLRLGGNAPVTLTVPLNASALGLAEARLVVARGELTVVFPVAAGTDMAVVNGALGELAQTLSQRFPHRTIRLRGEEEGRDALEPTEFNPLKDPVGRRK